MRLIARSTGILTLIVSAVLLARLIQVENLDAAWVLGAPLVSAALALLYPENRLLLLLGAMVLAPGLMPLMFGGYGALYMPSVVLMCWAALSVRSRVSTQSQ